MPIEVDSDAWESAEEPNSILKDTVSLLAENPDKAFRIREIADEIIGTDFETMEENDRLFDKYESGEISKEEYYEQKTDRIPAVSYRLGETKLEIRIQTLVNEGIVDVRSVETSKVDEEFSLSTLKYYTYAAE